MGPKAGEVCRWEHESWGSDTGILILLSHPPAGEPQAGQPASLCLQQSRSHPSPRGSFVGVK